REARLHAASQLASPCREPAAASRASLALNVRPAFSRKPNTCSHASRIISTPNKPWPVPEIVTSLLVTIIRGVIGDVRPEDGVVLEELHGPGELLGGCGGGADCGGQEEQDRTVLSASSHTCLRVPAGHSPPRC